MEQLRRAVDLERRHNDAGGDQIQAHHGEHPAVLRLQQAQADQEPAQNDTEKELCDLLKQQDCHKTFPSTRQRRSLS